ncbi:AAA family ATPase [Rhizobium sp. BK376]|uniref:ATP-dependent nuclease n=1 Tax=Rhizobium sp. BK376 TaxID=2512149 RepID=UPI00104E09C7|nr:AAA family ATPase [Rhizobium sp. BK376]TCR80782.1 putative ATP-dependent endonuclease of OLD family [Rhizobium sp. BK376]
MYLQRVKIENFRIFENFEVDLNKTLNIIVGENNSGKTALIDAIRYTLSSRTGEWLRILETDFRRGATRFSIRLKFADLSTQQAAAFLEHLTFEETGEQHRPFLYVTLAAELTEQIVRGTRQIRSDIRSGASGEGPSIEREAREYLSGTYLKPLRDAEAELSGGRGSRLAQVLNAAESFRNAAHVNSLLDAVIQANVTILGNPGIADSLARIKTQLKGLDFANTPLSPIIEIVGGTDLEALGPVERKQMLKAVLERLQLLIDESERMQGLGYSNLLFMATELLLLEEEQDDFPMLLIEEPEAHLHPQLQMKFLKAIREGFGGIGKPALQSILTTHSPNLASKSDLGSLIIMSGGKAFPLRKGHTELGDDDYVFLEKFLDVTKANLFFAKGVIIVEGDGENILLPTIAKLLGRPLDDYGVSIVNVGSTAFARYANIFKRRNLGDAQHVGSWLPIPVVCVRDMDLRPEGAKIAEDNPFGFIPYKPRGAVYWESHYDGNAEARTAWVTNRKQPQGQNVRVEISDHWTFEYSLLMAGLSAEVHEAAPGADVPFAQLPADPTERALTIYGRISVDKSKTETAYKLGPILERRFTAQLAPAPAGETEQQAEERHHQNTQLVEQTRQDLRAALPSYLVRAIDYVTGLIADGA